MSAPRVLLIEDDAAVQTVLYDVLCSAGYEVHVAMPDDAVYVAHEVAPAVLLLGCDGCGSVAPAWLLGDVLRRELPEVVLIMLTTSADAIAEISQRARGCVFDAGLCKPFGIGELLETITRHAR